MSLLDTNDLDPRLTPDLLLKVYGISKQLNPVYTGECQIYSKGYINSKFINKQILIEVWYPGSYYAGTLWRYTGIALKKNMVYIQFLNSIHTDSYWNRLEYVYSDLTLEEFDFMYKALKNNDVELLDKLYIHKPFTKFEK